MMLVEKFCDALYGELKDCIAVSVAPLVVPPLLSVIQSTVRVVCEYTV